MGGEAGPMESSNAEFNRAKLCQDSFFQLKYQLAQFSEWLLWCWWSTPDLHRHKRVLNFVDDTKGGSPGMEHEPWDAPS